MAIDPADLDGSGRLADMIEEFRAAQRRRFVRQGIELWTRTEEANERRRAGPQGIITTPGHACSVGSVQDGTQAPEDLE